MGKGPELAAGRPHFHRIVGDMKLSIDFYVVQLKFFYDHGVPEMVWLTRPGMLLTLSPGEPKPEGSSYFGFALDSAEELERCFDRLFEQRLRLSGPPDIATGRGWFYLYDPDGYPIVYSWTKLDYPEKG